MDVKSKTAGRSETSAYPHFIGFRVKAKMYDWLQDEAERTGSQVSELLRQWVYERMKDNPHG